MKTTTDVLIAGAGPVGLLLATELSRDGVDVLLIDRHKTRSFFCKALGVTPRTLEIFEDIGIAQDAIDSGVWLQGVSAFNDGVPESSMDVPTDLPFGSLSLAQFDTERLLEACLHRCGGSVSYGHTLTGFEAKADGVRAQIQGPDGETRTVDCRWLVGCDGAHSRVRGTVGLEFAGGQYPQTFVLADLEVDWDLPRGRMYRFNATAANQSGGAALAAVPVHGSARRYRLSTVVPESAMNTSSDASGETFPATLDQITALMTPILPKGTILSSLRLARKAATGQGQLPCQIVRILKTRVHALAADRRMQMRGVAGQEHASCRIGWHALVVGLPGQSLHRAARPDAAGDARGSSGPD